MQPPSGGVAVCQLCTAGPDWHRICHGRFTRVAPVALVQIRQITVSRGDRVEAGEILVELERRDAKIALAEASAALAQAENHLADLRQGKRPEEIGVIEANLASAQTQATDAFRTRDRVSNPASRGVVTVAQRDDTINAARELTGDHRLIAPNATSAQAEALIARGDVAFVVTVSLDFGRRIERNDNATT